ncbi:MAG: gliding motility-associated C-terminal domain-containing protein [Bacteroidia bacterium]
MKKTFFLLLFSLCLLAFTTKAQPQNLVTNPSFEISDTCPNNLGEISIATPWISPTLGTPDYYNTCASAPSGVNAPNNVYGSQNAHSGLGYGGFVTYSLYDSNYREYLQVQLLHNLIKGKKYCVSFFVSLADSVEYSTKDMGIFFSTKAITSTNFFNLNQIPQIVEDTNITNKVNWTIVSGSFIADSTYSYITIGNFDDDLQCNALPSGVSSSSPQYGGAYYYIDDVSVTECDDTIATNDDVVQIPNVITPNNDGKNDYFVIENLPDNSELTIYNRWGNNVYQSLNYQNNWKADEVNAGTYYYLLTLPNKEVKKGFLEVIK